MQTNQMIFEFRAPRSVDGHAIHNLIRRCPPLDTNSLYCNLLQCSYFRDSSIAVEHNGNIVGFVSGFITHKKPNVLFVWQVAVHEEYRGIGLAKKMLTELLKRDGLNQVTHIETTITPDNTSSWRLFTNLSASLKATIKSKTLFDQTLHFANKHKSEKLVRIGPIKRERAQAITTKSEEMIYENF